MTSTSLRLALLAATALLTSACTPDTGEQTVEFKATVTVAEARNGTVEQLLSTTGTVRAREEAKLVAEGTGALRLGRDPATGRRLAVGDAVRRGQLIAIVAADDVRAQARLSARKQVLEAAESEFARTQKLFEEGVVSQLVLDEKRSALANARADIQQALLQEGKSSLESPLDGYLTKVTTAADGETLSTGTVVAEVMDFDECVVDLDLGSGEVMDVKPGLPVRVRNYASERVFEGVIERIAPAIDPVSRTFRVEVGVSNPDHALRPGMFVKADVVLQSKAEVLTVPSAAVVSREGRWTVFVVEAQTARLRPVDVGLAQEDVAEIVKGLSSGERVVISGQDTLKDGARVVVSE